MEPYDGVSGLRQHEALMDIDRWTETWGLIEDTLVEFGRDEANVVAVVRCLESVRELHA